MSTPSHVSTSLVARDPRLPSPGTILQKITADRVFECAVLEDGFSYAGTTYTSLSAAARAAAKDMGRYHKAVNGFDFWGVGRARAVACPAAPAPAPPVNSIDRYRQILMPDAIEAAEKVRRFYLKRRIPDTYGDDIRQQAFVVAVESVKDYDPAKGDPVPYLFEAAKTSVGMEIARWMAPPTVSESAIKKGKRFRAAKSLIAEDGTETNPADLLADPAPSPEQQVDLGRARQRRAEVAAKLATETRRLLAYHFDPKVARAVAALEGCGPRAPSLEEEARRRGIEVVELTKAHARWKRLAARSAMIGALRRSLYRIEAGEALS